MYIMPFIGNDGMINYLKKKLLIKFAAARLARGSRSCKEYGCLKNPKGTDLIVGTRFKMMYFLLSFNVKIIHELTYNELD